MEIISHRGFWETEEEKNAETSFQRSFINNYGTETDLRDLNGEIVISHNMPLLKDNPMTINDFFELYNKYSINKTLALNVKSDGLQEQLKSKLLEYNIQNYFVFDMSIPDTRGYIRNDINFYIRLSEIEKEIIFEDQTKGVWLDAFEGLWYDQKYLNQILEKNIKIAIVSFELHRRNHLSQWNWIKENDFHLHQNVILCTDIPNEANLFFSTK